MPVGLCPRCTKRNNCGFRQPGTWVVECGLYEYAPPVTVELPEDMRDLAGAPQALGGSHEGQIRDSE